MFLYLPETKNIPLEEMAKLFGDDVAIYEADLHVDHNTHELVVNERGQLASRVATGGVMSVSRVGDVENAMIDVVAPAANK